MELLLMYNMFGALLIFIDLASLGLLKERFYFTLFSILSFSYSYYELYKMLN